MKLGLNPPSKSVISTDSSSLYCLGPETYNCVEKVVSLSTKDSVTSQFSETKNGNIVVFPFQVEF